MAITRNRNIVLLIIVGVLLLTNIGMALLFLNLKQPGGRSGRDMRGKMGLAGILEQKAGFSKQQLSAYEQLREQHWRKMKPLLADMRNAKDTFYRLLYQPDVTDSILHRTAVNIGNKQTAIDLQTFRHFQQVRNLCDATQRPRFDSLIHQVVYKMAAPFRRDRKELHERTKRP